MPHLTSVMRVWVAPLATWGPVTALSSALVVLIALGLGCSTTRHVVFDRDADFSLLRTWEFAKRSEPEASAGRSEPELARLIRAGLRSKGYVRTPQRPDFRVSYRLVQEVRTEIVSVPRATYLLSSNDSTPSYLIGGTGTEKREFVHVLLSIDILDGEGRAIWKGVFRDRLDSGTELELERVVRDLLARFPQAPPPPEPAAPGQLAAPFAPTDSWPIDVS